MAMTRKQLREMGLTEEQVESVIGMHIETVEGLKGELQSMQAELIAQPEAADAEDWRAKYDGLQQEFDAYRAEVESREQRERVEAAYRALLREADIDPRRIDLILRVTDLSGLSLNDDGTLADADALRESVRREWADFILTHDRRGARVSAPPRASAVRPTRAEILGIRDTAERQRSIAENHELFGF